MTQFIAMDRNVEVSGRAIIAFVDGMGDFREKALLCLRENGITDVTEEGWYPQQAWLDAFRKMSEQAGSFTLFNMGRLIPERAVFPSGIDTIEKALASIDVAYHMNHRLFGQVMYDRKSGAMLEGIGHYRFIKLEGNRALMECTNPFPCDFDRGIVEAMAGRFKPASVFSVGVNHYSDGSCRKDGDDSCTYLITW